MCTQGRFGRRCTPGSAWARTPSPRCVGLPPRAPQPAKRRRRSPFSAPKWGAAAAACSQTARSQAATLAARPDIPDAEGMGTARTFSRARFARLESESRGARCTPRRRVWPPDAPPFRRRARRVVAQGPCLAATDPVGPRRRRGVMRLGLPGPLSVSFCGEVDFRMCLGAGLWTPTGHMAAISALCLRLLFK